MKHWTPSPFTLVPHKQAPTQQYCNQKMYRQENRWLTVQQIYLRSFLNYPEYKTDEVRSIKCWFESTHFIQQATQRLKFIAENLYSTHRLLLTNTCLLFTMTLRMSSIVWTFGIWQGFKSLYAIPLTCSQKACSAELLLIGHNMIMVPIDS